MERVHVFSSAALNYLPKVRVLFASLRRYHPEWQLHLALADRLVADVELPAEIHPLEDLGIPGWRGWAFCHDVVELSTAIKAFLLRRLLRRDDVSRVLYLDPDIVLFSRLDDVLDALEDASVVLTPHLSEPECGLEAVVGNEIPALQHGTYNLGFLGVSDTGTGRRFADWWCERLYHFCRGDTARGFWVDQRWIDLVPGLFEGVAILRSPRLNVAPWNLSRRKLDRDREGHYRVAGERLGFYHFTGFDSGAHSLMVAKYAGRSLSIAKRLIDWYARETGGGVRGAAMPWAFGSYSDGTPIGQAERVLYRMRVDLQQAYPDPFDAQGYLVWCGTQGLTEFPGLFGSGTVAEKLGTLACGHGPGWRGGQVQLDKRDVFKLLWSCLLAPRTFGKAIFCRGWLVLRREGLGGVRRRLPKKTVVGRLP